MSPRRLKVRMPAVPLRKPLLPSRYFVQSEPPDTTGEEGLYFRSERRQLKLKGRSLRIFRDLVIPLLDGEHTVEEIRAQLANLLPPEALEYFLHMLTERNLLEDADQDPSSEEV